MVPLLCQHLEDIVRSLASRAVLKDVMTKANTCVSFIKVDFKSTSVHKRPEDVDVGVAAKFEMQVLVEKKEVNDTQCFKLTQFYFDLLCVLTRLKRVALARQARCFIPSSLVENRSISPRRFSSLLEVLYIKDPITNFSAENAKKKIH